MTGRQLILWGATGQAKVLNELASRLGWRVVLLVDNRDLATPLTGVPLVVGREGLDAWLADVANHGSTRFAAAAAVGGARGADRLALMDILADRGLELPELIHPAAFVALDAQLSQGCQVLAHASVCSQASLGKGVIVNTNASVDHDCQLGDGVHIGPGARLTGEIKVGRHAFVGAGAIILPRLEIGAGAIVGAGAVVTRNVSEGAVVAGIPARPMGQQNVRH